MDIYFTKEAVAQLEEHFKSSSSYLFITYELGGCGNPLDGVIHIQHLTTLPKQYVSVSTNWLPVFTNQSTSMLLENSLMIDVNSKGLFVKSKSQLYNCILSSFK